MYTLKLILVPNFSSLGWFWFSSAVISSYQLLTAVDSWKEKNLIGIFMYTLSSTFASSWQLIWKKFHLSFCVQTKLYTYAKFQLSSLNFIFISCQQLLSAVDNWWQLIWIIFDWNFHVHSVGDILAKFQLSRLIFIFISFWQLLSAVDSWWQLSRKKNQLEFSSTP